MEPIAYTYEASEHCADCAEKRFGRNERGFIAEEATDNEGNPVGTVFSPFEDRDMVCGTCGDIIHKIEAERFRDEDEACKKCLCSFADHDTFDQYDDEGVAIGIRGGEGALACSMHIECNNFEPSGHSIPD